MHGVGCVVWGTLSWTPDCSETGHVTQDMLHRMGCAALDVAWDARLYGMGCAGHWAARGAEGMHRLPTTHRAGRVNG